MLLLQNLSHTLSKLAKFRGQKIAFSATLCGMALSGACIWLVLGEACLESCVEELSEDVVATCVALLALMLLLVR